MTDAAAQIRKLSGHQAATELPCGTDPENGRETILVVEDDNLVRTFVVGSNSKPGLHHAGGGQCGGSLGRYRWPAAEIDLLFTDMIMPGSMNGRQLADEALQRRA